MKVTFVTSQVITRHATMKRAVGLGAPLQRQGWDVEVLAEDHPDNRDYFAPISELKVSYFPKLPARQERAFKESMINRRRSDLVHICGLGWRNAIRPQAGPLVLMDHVELESSIAGTPPLRRLAQYHLERWARRYYIHSIAASRWLYHWLSQNQLARIQHLPYGADPLNDDFDHAAFIAEKQLKPFLLYCGGLHRNYGFWTLLESCIALCRRIDDFAAVITGGGPELEPGRAAVSAAGLSMRIRLPGYVPEKELNQYLSCATAHVSPLNDTITDRARCPSKIPLYMMTRRPIVTCRIGEASEYLGEKGYYYTPGSAESFQMAVTRIWTSRPGPVAYDLTRVAWSSLAEQYREFWQTHALALAGPS